VASLKLCAVDSSTVEPWCLNSINVNYIWV